MTIILASEEAMFRQVQKEEEELIQQAEKNRERREFVNNQILMNRKFSDNFKINMHTNAYQQTQNKNYLTNLKMMK